MLNFVPREFVVFAGLLAVPAAAFAQHKPAPAIPKDDPRLARLHQFFSERNCPLQHLATDFLVAADRNELDWRLLPSISVVESGGGKDYRNNNIFGWNCARAKFPSVRAGIHIVAAKLASSKLYRHKTVDGILSTYNRNPEYGEKVKAVMQTLGSSDASAVVIASLN